MKLKEHPLIYVALIIISAIYLIREIIEDWDYWPLFLLVVIVCVVWEYIDEYIADKNKGSKHGGKIEAPKQLAPEKPKTQTKESQQPTPKPIEKEVKIDPRILTYVEQKPEVITENGKRINKRTGYPLAKQSSIETSECRFEEVLNYPDNSEPFDVDDYFIGVYLPYFFAGEIAYKRGDWDIAEAIWLSVLGLCPESVSGKLAIMYRKQHRYQDVADMYVKAINYADKFPRKVRDDYYQRMVSDLIHAGEKAELNQKKDKSVGLQDYESPADMEFAASLEK